MTALERTYRQGREATRGMTLVEVIVAAAILAIISLAVFGAFSATLNLQQRNLKSKSDAENVEARIAQGEKPANSADITLTLPGDTELKGSADTFMDGQRSYTVIEGEKAPVQPAFLYGDGAGTNENGGSATFTTPEKGYYRLEVWGAAGGDGNNPRYDYGGKGGYAAGTVWLSGGQKLLVYAGGAGKRGNGVAGGYNGAGGGANSSTPGKNIGSGGGGTDICVGLGLSNYRIIVAGGGGGGGHYNTTSAASLSERGGNGGGPVGENGSGSVNYIGKGGGQTAGGALALVDADTVKGFGYFGYGGTTRGYSLQNGTPSRTGGGGGGGWYGGSSGSWQGGGGGSGYVLTKNSAIPPDYFLGDGYDHTKYYFVESTVVNVRVDQAGYQPHPGGTKARGGFIRITYLGQELP